MRADTELFKDKIEVSLDGRQVFYLFFGGAIIASLVFVLGVMVGKRVEARSASSAAASAHDPLAALDRLSRTRSETRSFRSALIEGDEDPLYDVDIALADKQAADKQAADKPAPDKHTAVVAPKPALAVAAVAAKPLAPRSDKAVATPEQAKADQAKAEQAKAAQAKAEQAKAAQAKAAQAKAAQEKAAQEKAAQAKAEEARAAQAKAEEARAEEARAEEARAEESGPPRFTLQLSSFRDRVEADTFFDKLEAAGYDPYIVEAEVPDKGLWYRVRLGRYPSYDAAVAAKKKFEESQRIIAYVTRIGK